MPDRDHELAARYSLAVRPDAKVAQLSNGGKQAVEICTLLYRQSTILIFDELIGQTGTDHLSET